MTLFLEFDRDFNSVSNPVLAETKNGKEKNWALFQKTRVQSRYLQRHWTRKFQQNLTSYQLMNKQNLFCQTAFKST